MPPPRLSLPALLALPTLLLLVADPAAAKLPSCTIHIEAATFDRAVYAAGEPIAARLEATVSARDAEARAECLDVWSYYGPLIAIEPHTGQHIVFRVEAGEGDAVVMRGNLFSGHAAGVYTIPAGPGLGAPGPRARPDIARGVTVAAPIALHVAENPDADLDPPAIRGARFRNGWRGRPFRQLALHLRDAQGSGYGSVTLVRTDGAARMTLSMQSVHEGLLIHESTDFTHTEGRWIVEAVHLMDRLGNQAVYTEHPLLAALVIDLDQRRQTFLSGSLAARAALIDSRLPTGRLPDVRPPPLDAPAP